MKGSPESSIPAIELTTIKVTPTGVTLSNIRKTSSFYLFMSSNFEKSGGGLLTEFLHLKHDNFTKRDEEIFERYAFFLGCICRNTEYKGAEEDAQ